MLVLLRANSNQSSSRPSCPKLSPTKITHREESVIRNLLSASEYFHFGINSLAQFAKRNALVFASTTSWYRIMKQFNLRRSGVRLFPKRPRIGARAARPNQMWHIDQTVLRVADGSRVFIRAIIDNYSRYILSWQVSDNYGVIKCAQKPMISLNNSQTTSKILVPISIMRMP